MSELEIETSPRYLYFSAINNLQKNINIKKKLYFDL